MMGDAMRHFLSCSALAVGIIAYLPLRVTGWKEWAIFAGAIALALVLQATPNVVINLSAVVLILFVLAPFSNDRERATLNTLATVVFLFVLYRFSRDAIPTVWQITNEIGSLFGMLSVVWGKEAMPIGATFAGIDLLVLILLFWVFWRTRQSTPRGKQTIIALAAVFLAQLLYLVVLSFSEQILAVLPAAYYITEDETNRTGVWVWQNAVRAAIPWNLPALATLLQLFVLGGMVRTWNAVAEPVKDKKIAPSSQRDVLSGKEAIRQIVLPLLPPVLALLLVLSALLSLPPTSMKEKTVLANLESFVSWRKPDYGQVGGNGFGMLPLFIESLGGRLTFSQHFTPEELAKADLVLLLHPSQAWTEEEKNRIREYVNRGGNLLVGADTFRRESGKKSTTNDIAAFSGIQAEESIAAFLVDGGEQTFETIAHPAVAGLDASRNAFGFLRGAPLRVSWPAAPFLTNPWGWGEPAMNVSEGNQPNLTLDSRLGDLIVAAERSYGSGKVVVLGDANALSNDRLPISYGFVGRLLASMAHGTGSSVGLLYQSYLAVLSGLLIGLLSYSPQREKTLMTAAVFTVSLALCNMYVAGAASPTPHRPEIGNAFDIAYIDTSHIGRYCERLWDPYRGKNEEDAPATSYDFGFAGFTRALMRHGFLPLRMAEFNPQQYSDSALTVSIAPGKPFSTAEISDVKKYVEAGGVFLCMVGAEEAGACESLLNAFDFSIAPMPVALGENEIEPWPHGAILYNYDDDAPEEKVMFYAAWNVRSLRDENLFDLLNDKDGKLLVAARGMGKGKFVVIADTYFASNQLMEVLHPENVRYWNYLLQQITKRRAPADSGDALKERGLE